MKNRNAAKRPGGKKAKENLLAKTGEALHFFWNRDWLLGLLLDARASSFTSRCVPGLLVVVCLPFHEESQ
jgi:hypothetical protein